MAGSGNGPRGPFVLVSFSVGDVLSRIDGSLSFVFGTHYGGDTNASAGIRTRNAPGSTVIVAGVYPYTTPSA